MPPVNDFCRIFREAVQACGGPEQVFNNLAEDTRDVFFKLAPTIEIAQIWRNLLDNEEYRARFYLLINDDADRELLRAFIDSWIIWRISYPDEDRMIKLFLIPSLEIVLNSAPSIVNDVFSCNSLISLDAFTEEFTVRSIFKLNAPDKKLGGPDVLLMSGRLNSFLETIRLMLQSLKLEGVENNLFKSIGKEDVILNLLENINAVETALSDIKTQFQNLK